MAPLIGITAGNDPKVPEHYILRWDYIHGVSAAGGIPVILAPVAGDSPLQILDRLDGLILTGGMDIAPSLYHQQPHPKTFSCTPERDVFEMALAQCALARDLPLLGICRGMQMLNLALGGSLIQHIPDHKGEQVSHDDPLRPRAAIAHSVQIEKGSRLAEIVGANTLRVNSFHHQAIGMLGEGGIVTARAEDGIIEGLEVNRCRFALGVQWHPESLWQQSPFFALFLAIVDASRRYAASKA